MKIDQNFVAIITGGSSGLGLATAKLLSSMGAKVVIVGTNEEKGKEAIKQTKLVFFKAEVSDQNQVKALFEYTVTNFGKVDAVINCAGIGYIQTLVSAKGGVKEVPSNKLIENALKINVIGSFNMAKYAAKTMASQPQVNGERGIIILVSSLAAEEGQKGQVGYGASKGAIHGMVLPLARELGKTKIRAMCLNPGIFETPLTYTIPQKGREHIFAQIPLGRFGLAEEFAKVAQSVIENPYVNGTIWRIDGAMRLPYI